MDTLITAPVAEPISITEAKLHLRVDDTTDNDLITGLIVAARVWCEEHTRRAFVTQTRELTLNAWPIYRTIHFPALPLASVTSVKYTDEDGVESTLSSAGYVVDTIYGKLKLKDSTSLPGDTLQVIAAIKVRYVAGYGLAVAVPQPIKQAMYLLIGEWYEQREAGAVRNLSAVSALLSPYRNWPLESR